jgi:hypothetical protein
MACAGDIRDFFSLLASTLTKGGFNIVVNETDECFGFDCKTYPNVSQGFGRDECGVPALLLTDCCDECWVLVYDDKVLTSLSGDIIKFC